MKNDATTIKQLLEKFYDAETTEQDEEILKEYFRSDVAPEFEIYKAQFTFYDVGYGDDRGLSRDFDDKFFAAINTEPKLVKSKQTSYLWYAGIAATFMVAFGLFFLTRTTNQVSDIEYNQAVSALILISEKMDIASGDLQNLHVIEKSLNHFDAFKVLENYGEHLTNNGTVYE